MFQIGSMMLRGRAELETPAQEDPRQLVLADSGPQGGLHVVHGDLVDALSLPHARHLVGCLDDPGRTGRLGGVGPLDSR